MGQSPITPELRTYFYKQKIVHVYLIFTVIFLYFTTVVNTHKKNECGIKNISYKVLHIHGVMLVNKDVSLFNNNQHLKSFPKNKSIFFKNIYFPIVIYIFFEINISFLM